MRIYQNEKNLITVIVPEDLKKIVKESEIYPMTKAILRDRSSIFGNDFKILFLKPEYFFPSPLNETNFQSFFSNNYSSDQLEFLYKQIYYDFLMGDSQDQGFFTRAAYERFFESSDLGGLDEDSDYESSGLRGLDEDYDYFEMRSALCDKDGFLQNYYLGPSDPDPKCYAQKYPILPPFVGEDNWVYGESAYELIPPFFFTLEDKYYFVPEQNNLPPNKIADQRSTIDSIERINDQKIKFIYCLSALSFSEFISEMLWSFFSQEKRPKGVEAITQQNECFDGYSWSWINTFLEIFLQPRFYDTLVSLDLTFSEEERRELREKIMAAPPFFPLFFSIQQLKCK